MASLTTLFVTVILFGVAAAESSTTCSLKVSLGSDGFPFCSYVCKEGEIPLWYDGVIYKRFPASDMADEAMVAVKFSEGSISECTLVEYRSDEELAANDEALSACLKENEVPTSVNTCPTGFTEIDGTCYLITPKLMSYGKNKDHCKRFDGDLAIFESKEEQEQVIALLHENVYLGLNDKNIEGSFIVNGVNYTGDARWKDGEPNNHGGNEDCVIIKPGFERAFLWWDVTCSRAYRGLCEAEKKVIEYPTCAEGQVLRDGSCYFVSQNTMTYEEGKLFCRENGGYLAFVNDQSEQDFIAETFQSTVLTGLSDVKKEGDFIVPYYGVPFYTNWSSDFSNSEDLDCVALDSNSGFSWSLVDCDAEEQVLCEVPVSSGI